MDTVQFYFKDFTLCSHDMVAFYHKSIFLCIGYFFLRGFLNISNITNEANKQINNSFNPIDPPKLNKTSTPLNRAMQIT